jgi:hypothetical protein
MNDLLNELLEAIEVEFTMSSMLPAAFSRQSVDRLWLIAERIRLEKRLRLTTQRSTLGRMILNSNSPGGISQRVKYQFVMLNPFVIAED